MRFYDIVDKKYDPGLRQRVLTFPDTGACEDCGGHRYVYANGGRIDDPRLALQIKLVEFGYTHGYRDPVVVEPRPCCRLGDDEPSVRSVLRLDQKWGVFPTLSVCSGCGGYKSVFRSEDIAGPRLAWRTALVQFGDSTCKNFDNDPPSHPCNCEARLKELDEQIAALPLVSDSGWSGAGGIPRRGIRDYARSMEFSRELEEDEMDLLREWLQRKDCPGWTGVMVRRHGGGRYGFTTTWDSSD